MLESSTEEYSEVSMSPSMMNEGGMIYLNVSLKHDKGTYRKTYSFDCSMGDKSIIKSGIEAMMEIYTEEMKKAVDSLIVTGTKEQLNEFMNNPKNKIIDVESHKESHVYETILQIDEVLKLEK